MDFVWFSVNNLIFYAIDDNRHANALEAQILWDQIRVFSNLLTLNEAKSCVRLSWPQSEVGGAYCNLTAVWIYGVFSTKNCNMNSRFLSETKSMLGHLIFFLSCPTQTTFFFFQPKLNTIFGPFVENRKVFSITLLSQLRAAQHAQ